MTVFREDAPTIEPNLKDKRLWFNGFQQRDCGIEHPLKDVIWFGTLRWHQDVQAHYDNCHATGKQPHEESHCSRPQILTQKFLHISRDRIKGHMAPGDRAEILPLQVNLKICGESLPTPWIYPVKHSHPWAIIEYVSMLVNATRWYRHEIILLCFPK